MNEASSGVMWSGEESAQILALLRGRHEQLVLAESCTAGLIAATLARVPGMSQHLCGSLVVYQIASKLSWLGLPSGAVTEANVVSRETAERMSEGALLQTSQATAAMAITGHLGPGAPAELDGVAWLSIRYRGCVSESYQLKLAEAVPAGTVSLRVYRQQQAVEKALALLCESLRTAAVRR